MMTVEPSRSPLRTALLSLCLVVGLAGCGVWPADRSGQRIEPAIYSVDATRTMMDTSFQALNGLYVENISLNHLVPAALKKLFAADPTLALTQQDGQLILIQGQTTLALLPRPSDNDPSAWARTVATLIDMARQRSVPLRALTADQIYQDFLVPLTAQLDGISRYDNPDRARDNRAHREGFGGIGIRIDQKDPRQIYAILPDTPAAKVGMLAGDTLLTINGEPTLGKTNRQIVDALRGPRGSEVIVTVERTGSTTPLKFTITRQLIIDQTITWRRDAGDIGYVRISDFTLYTSNQLENALKAGLRGNRPLRGLVIDLRDNPGGFLSQGTYSADLFLESGLLLTSRGRNPEAAQRFEATSGDILHGLPLVLLVNGRSASAAEIMTAALQDNGRAVVIGSSTYGKGTVQKITHLPNGAELILTWARFHAPSGYRLQKLGVLPNLCTSTAGGNAEEPIQLLRQGRTDPAALLAQRRAADSLPDQRQATISASCPAFTGERAGDLELDVAHRLLADPALYQRALRGTAMAARS